MLELAPPTHSDGSYVVPEKGPFGPTEPVWKYEAPDKKSFHSGFIAGARRLPGGNTLICSGADGRVFEITREGKIVWEYWDPYSGQVRLPDGTLPQPVGEHTYAVFRAAKIPPQHPALAVAERSGDGALAFRETTRDWCLDGNPRTSQSGVALRLPPQSKTR